MKVLRARTVLFLSLLGCSQGGAVISPPPTGTGGNAADASGAGGVGGAAGGSAGADAASMADGAKDAAELDVGSIDTAAAPADVRDPAMPASEAKREAFLAQLRKIVNPMPALAPMLMPATTSNGVTVQDFSFASQPSGRNCSWRGPQSCFP